MGHRVQRLMAAMPENDWMKGTPEILTCCGLQTPMLFYEDLENTVSADEVDVVVEWVNVM
jgi:hypothetical protein